MKLNLGVRAHDLGKLSAEDSAALVGDLGLGAVHLALHKAIAGVDAEAGSLSPGLGRMVARAYAARGVDVAILGCYIDPVASNAEKRADGLARFREHLRYARDFGCSIVGTETGEPPGGDVDRAFGVFIDSLKNMVEAAESYGTLVGIEPVAGRHTIRDRERVAVMLEAVPSPNLGIICDPVNIFPDERPADMDKEIIDFVDSFGDRILAVHAKDLSYAKGVKRWDLPAGRGELPYGTLMSVLAERKPGIHVLLENTSREDAWAAAAFIRRAAGLG